MISNASYLAQKSFEMFYFMGLVDTGLLILNIYEHMHTFDYIFCCCFSKSLDAIKKNVHNIRLSWL